MSKRIVRKITMRSCVFCLLVVLLPGAALSWDLAAHTFIEQHLYKKQGQTDSAVLQNRIYGAGALDLFNIRSPPPRWSSRRTCMRQRRTTS